MCAHLHNSLHHINANSGINAAASAPGPGAFNLNVICPEDPSVSGMSMGMSMGMGKSAEAQCTPPDPTALDYSDATLGGFIDCGDSASVTGDSTGATDLVGGAGGEVWSAMPLPFAMLPFCRRAPSNELVLTTVPTSITWSLGTCAPQVLVHRAV